MAGTLIISLDFELFWGMLDVCPLEKYQDHVLGGRKAIPGLSRDLDVAQHVDHAGNPRFPLFGNVVAHLDAFGRTPCEIGQDAVRDACHEYDEERDVDDQQTLQERFFILHLSFFWFLLLQIYHIFSKNK